MSTSSRYKEIVRAQRRSLRHRIPRRPNTRSTRFPDKPGAAQNHGGNDDGSRAYSVHKSSRPAGGAAVPDVSNVFLLHFRSVFAACACSVKPYIGAATRHENNKIPIICIQWLLLLLLFFDCIYIIRFSFILDSLADTPQIQNIPRFVCGKPRRVYIDDENEQNIRTKYNYNHKGTMCKVKCLYVSR